MLTRSFPVLSYVFIADNVTREMITFENLMQRERTIQEKLFIYGSIDLCCNDALFSTCAQNGALKSNYCLLIYIHINYKVVKDASYQ